MKKPLRALFVLIYLAISVPLSCAQAQAYTPVRGEIATPLSRVVTASDYAVFLNAVAASDADHLFNEQMASNPATACIVRVGAPGRWHYEVIEGRENIPVSYVSQQDEARYCAEEECSLATASALEMIDSASFANGGCTFEVDRSSSPLLMLASASTSDRSSSIVSISEAAALLGLLVVPELMMRGSAADAAAARAASEHTVLDASSDRLSDVSDASDLSDGSLQSCASSQSAASARTTASMGKRNQYTLGLVDFTQAALEHPTADRFIIDEGDTEAIMPSKSSLFDRSKNIKENKTIALAFKDVLRNEYSRELAERLIPGQRDSVWDSFSLGSANIFQYINKVEKRITEHTILGTKESDLEVLRSHVERKKINVGETQEFHEKHQSLFEAKSGEKTLLEKSDAAVGSLVDAIGNAHVLGLPVGPVIKAVAAGARKVEQRMEQAPLKLAKKIAEGAKEDHDVVEKRFINFQRKEAKKNGTNAAKRGVRFDDAASEATSAPFTPAPQGGIDLGINTSARGRTKAQNDHVALWEEAMRLETAAEFAEFKASKSETPANIEAYKDACQLAKKAWTTAAEAREAAANTIRNERDKNLLLADVTTAEEKADDWGRALKEARARHNALASSASSLLAAAKIQDDDVKIAADAVSQAEALAKSEAKRIADAKARKEELAAMAAAVEKSQRKEAEIRVAADQKAAEESEAVSIQHEVAKKPAQNEEEKAVASHIYKGSSGFELRNLIQSHHYKRTFQEADREPLEFSNSANDIAYTTKGEEMGLAGNPELTDLLTQAAEKAELAARYKAQAEAAAAIPWPSKNEEEINRLYNLTRTANNAVTRFIEAISPMSECIHQLELLRSAEAPQEQRALWAQAIKKFQRAADYEAKAVEAESVANKREAYRLDAVYGVAGFAWRVADEFFEMMPQIINAMNKAAEVRTTREGEAAKIWSQVIVQLQSVANSKDEALLAQFEGDEYKNQRFSDAADAAQRAAATFANALDYIVKAAEAKATGDRNEAALWTKGARHIKSVAQYHTRVAEASKQGREAEADNLNAAATYERRAADYITRSIPFYSKPAAVKKLQCIQLSECSNQAAIHYQKVAGYNSQAAKARADKKEINQLEDAISFALMAADTFAKSANYFSNAIKYRDIEYHGTLDFWDNMAEQFKAAAEHYSEAAQAALDGDRNEAQKLDWLASSLTKSAKYSANAIAAKASENEEEADLWTQAFNQIQFIADSRAQETRVYFAGNSSEPEDSEEDEKYIPRFFVDSEQYINGFLKAVKYLRKAKSAENPEEAELWTQAAKQLQSAAEYRAQASHAQAAGNKEEAKRLGALATYLTTKATDSALATVVEYTAKASTARAAGNLKEAELWTQAAKALQDATEYRALRVQSKAIGNEEEAKRLLGHWSGGKGAVRFAKAAANNFSEAIEYNRKASTARAAENEGEAKLWEQAAEQFQVAAEYRAQAAKEFAAGNEEEVKRLVGEYWGEGAANSAEAAANNFSKAIEYTGKPSKARAAENEEEADLWTQTAKQLQVAAKYRAQEAKAYAAGNQEEKEQLSSAAWSAEQAANNFSKAIEYIAKASTARAAKNEEEADLWTQTAKQLQSATEYRVKAAQAIEAGSKEEAQQLESIRYRLEQTTDESLEYVTKAWKARAAGNHEEAEVSMQAAKQLQDAAEEEGTRINVDQIITLIRRYTFKARLAKCAEAEQEFVEDRGLCSLWESAANLWIQAAGQFKNSAQLSDKKAIAAINAANRFDKSATCKTKAAWAKIAGRHELHNLWINAGEKSEQAAKYYAKMAEQSLPTDRAKAKKLDSVARSARIIALSSHYEFQAREYQSQATKFLAEGNQFASDLWSFAASLMESAAENIYPVNQNYEDGNISKAKSLIATATALSSEAYETVQIIPRLIKNHASYSADFSEVAASGNHLEAGLWLQVLMKVENVVKYRNAFERSIKAQLEDIDLFVKSMLYMPKYYVTEVFQATKKGNQKEANLWSKIAKQAHAKIHYNMKYAYPDRGYVSAAPRIEQSKINFIKALRYTIKASENSEQANLWTQVATLYEAVAWIYDKFVEDEVAESEEEENYILIGDRYESIANGLAKTARAKVSENKEHAAFQDVAVTRLVKGINQLNIADNKTAEAMKAYASGDKEEANKKLKEAASWRELAQLELTTKSICYEKEALSQREGDEIASGRWRAALAAAENASMYLERAIEAEVSQKLKEAASWRERVELQYINCENNMNAASAYYRWGSLVIYGNKSEAESWAKAGVAANKACIYLKKAIEAEGSEELNEYDSFCSEAVTQYKIAADYWAQAAQAYAAGNEEEAERLGGDSCNSGAAMFAEQAADTFIRAAVHTLKASTAIASGNTEEAYLWTQSATQYKIAAEYKAKSAQAFIANDQAEAQRWSKAGEYTKKAAEQLGLSHNRDWDCDYTGKGAASSLAEAKKSRIKGDDAVADLWTQTSSHYQTSAGYLVQSAQAYANGNEEEAEQFEKAAEAAQQAATELSCGGYGRHKNGAAFWLTQAAEASAEGAPKEATLWTQAASYYQTSAGYLAQSAKAYANSNDEEANQFKKAASSASEIAHQFAKAAEAQAGGNQEEADRLVKETEEKLASDQNQYILH